MTAHQPKATSSHITPIRRGDVVVAYQLRVNGGGPDNTKYFAALKLGGLDKAHQAAEQTARALGLPKSRGRGGSETGRLLKTSATLEPGIRFAWVSGQLAPVLRVVATWVDKRRIARNTSYSVERNGLDGALDKAIKARTSAGAPAVDRDTLLKALQRVHRAGPVT